MGRQIAHAITIEQLFDMIGVRFNPEKFESGPSRINWHFSDLEEDHVLGIQNATINNNPNTSQSNNNSIAPRVDRITNPPVNPPNPAVNNPRKNN